MGQCSGSCSGTRPPPGAVSPSRKRDQEAARRALNARSGRAGGGGGGGGKRPADPVPLLPYSHLEGEAAGAAGCARTGRPTRRMPKRKMALGPEAPAPA